MNKGYIVLHRQMLEWEWYDDHNTKILFLHLLLTANHTDKKWRGIHIKRGQVLTGLYSLSENTGLSVQQIRTALDKLISTNEITSKSTNQYRIIEVNNYDKYQLTNKQTNSRVTSKQQASNKQVTTTNTLKNEKNDKKRGRFTPPSLKEVKEYCKERNNSVDPETFIDFYSSKGWKVGNVKMKDWKASVRTWEKRQKDDQNKNNILKKDTSKYDELSR